MLGPDLWSVFEDLGHPRVLVLGDLGLERWAWGQMAGPDSGGGQRLRVERRENRPSGAARVARMLADLEAEAVCAGAVGADAEGTILRKLLTEAGVGQAYIVEQTERPTAVGERFIGRSSDDQPPHVWHVEDDAAPFSSKLESELTERMAEDVNDFDAVVIADRGHGTCSPLLVQKVIAAARDAHRPTIVSPSGGADLSTYFGAGAIVLNRADAEAASGVVIRDPDHAIKSGTHICRQQKIDHAFVTLGGEGIAVAKRQGRGKHVPTRSRGVSHVRGAGDMALATISLCCALGVNELSAARLANVASGQFIERAGGGVDRDALRSKLMQVKSLSAGKLLSRDDLAKKMEACRKQKRRIVFTNGCFDLLHAGHVTYLQEAAALGDLLVVGLNSDASVRGLKGPTRPVIRQEDRAALLAALSCVDFVTIFDEPTPADLIRLVRPDVLVKGGDYRAEEVVGYDFLQSYGGRVYIAPLVEGVSTTKILKSMAA